MKTKAVVLVLIVLAAAAAQAQTSELENRISAKLVDSLGNDAKSIRVAVFDGKAVLIGRVAERSTQELAEEVALYFPEIRSVDNQLKAGTDKPLLEGQLKGEGDDARLEMLVKKGLEAEIGKHVKQIEVEAVDGVVSIRGTVPDQARLKLAREATSHVKGVKKVVDLLRVKG
jgi:osmotically-inducible protein OsmY